MEMSISLGKIGFPSVSWSSLEFNSLAVTSSEDQEKWEEMVCIPGESANRRYRLSPRLALAMSARSPGASFQTWSRNGSYLRIPTVAFFDILSKS
uniref:Uncharacterized protein n=1 Tax=Oryza glumipatula TaxID=40148 RepID=A0A0D9ZR88_9ORYZ